MLSISSDCFARWQLRASTACGVMRTVRRLFLVFGSPRTWPVPLRVSVRRTLTVAFSRSTSPHFKPSSSPSPHAGVDGEHVEGFEPVTSCCFEQTSGLLRR